MTTSSERESDGWMRRRSPRKRTVTRAGKESLAAPSVARRTLGLATTAGLLVALLAPAPAWATPAESASSASAAPALNLRLDGRAAGRLLAASDSDSLEGGADKSSDAKAEGGEGAGKSDELKLTVTRGDGQKKKQADSGDSLAFLKDWPFWAIVGGVVLAGAATFMIVENHNQKHACGAVYDAGCFGAK